MKLTRAEIRFLANLFTNISAGWIGVTIITPNFINLYELKNITVLIFDVISVIFYSVFAIRLEEKLK